MMGKFNTTIAFLMGTAIGGAAVWYITRERYAQLAEEEINSVKEAYAQKERKKEKADKALQRYQGADRESDDSDMDGPKTPVVTAKVAGKGSISEYAQRIQNGASIEYSKTIVPPKASKPEMVQSEALDDAPYVISPDEFGELDGYTPVSLTYFSDGVLADEYGVIVDDVEEIIGNALNHFGEYEEDAVFVRNDAKRCDYEILLDEREYAEFLETLPPNI